MARPLAAPVSRSAALDIVGLTGTLLLVVLAALIVYPVVALAVSGLVAAGARWPLGLVLRSLAVAIAATLVAILPAVPLGYALTRANVPGRTRLWRVCRLGICFRPSSCR